jgi:hypothetical protein
MAALGISEALDEELEALQREFPAQLAIQDAAAPVEVTYSAAPPAPVFARAKVVATFPPHYPAGSPAALAVAETRGLSAGDAAKLRGLVVDSAHNAAGAAQVLTAFRGVRTFLGERNSPPPCAVCGGVFATGESATAAGGCVVLEPCLHAVHAGGCWERFYIQRVRERREVEAQLTAELGALEAEARAMEGWPACPGCGIAVDAGAARAAAAAALKTSPAAC